MASTNFLRLSKINQRSDSTQLSPIELAIVAVLAAAEDRTYTATSSDFQYEEDLKQTLAYFGALDAEGRDLAVSNFTSNVGTDVEKMDLTRVTVTAFRSQVGTAESLAPFTLFPLEDLPRFTFRRLPHCARTPRKSLLGTLSEEAEDQEGDSELVDEMGGKDKESKVEQWHTEISQTEAFPSNN